MKKSTDPLQALLERVEEMLVALLERVEKLENHQHSYYAPIGFAAKWCETAPQRELDNSAHEFYMQEMQAKKEAAS